jgi:hypothetical protein
VRFCCWMAALARVLHFREVNDGDVLFRQGDLIEETSGRFLVVFGSLLLFSQRQPAPRANSKHDKEHIGGRYGECVGSCFPGSTCGEVGNCSGGSFLCRVPSLRLTWNEQDATTDAIVRKTTVLAQTATCKGFNRAKVTLRVVLNPSLSNFQW